MSLEHNDVMDKWPERYGDVLCVVHLTICSKLGVYDSCLPVAKYSTWNLHWKDRNLFVHCDGL